ncbi:MAG TPA: Asp23/Gls24 family envelope stress response protein [Clostridia bacterium]|nr:Asp23/Gls24 family envelope stress response protein [Clostridia bacterium]
MKVYALIGQSGTGKSYKAFIVAKDRDIGYIIDDGLLIGGTRVIAGQSAKRESTKIASVRRALFNDPDHREKVKNALEEIKPEKIIVLGTSLKMVQEICQVLGLPEFHEILHIEDVSTEKEIELARKSRREDGKHVIPVPTFEIKKDFSGYFIDSLKVFSKKDRFADIVEKTIIRPTFSYLGKYELSKVALVQLISICVSKVERINKILRVRIENKPDGVIIDLDLSIKLITRIDLMIVELQKNLVEEIEYMTGLNVLSINVTVKGITT